MTTCRTVIRGLAAILIAALCAVTALGAAQAHFVLNGENRIVLLERGEDSLTVFMCIPAPLIYASELSRRESPGARVEAPFVTSEMRSGQTLHRLDRAAIAAAPDEFARFIASGYRFGADGAELTPEPGDVAVHLTVDAPPFTDAATARRSLDTAFTGSGDPFVGEADVDVALVFPGVGPEAEITLVSILPELVLPPDIFIDNHIVDFRGGGAQVLNVEGQMQEPVVLDGSVLSAAVTFVVEGVKHILEGPDHVLFVLCLTIAASSIGMLLWQVTGFTVGHSVTLIAGFLGVAPAGAWFTPTIETAIALSIVYAGLLAVWRRQTRFTILVTAAIGLLHGFGFSFVLGEILGRDSPHLILSLLSFNLGVEIGQVMIVVVAYALILLAGWLSSRLGQAVRWGIAGVSIAIACFWVVERVQLVAQSVQAS